ncbi:MAG: hypothetical protein ACREFE_15985, partial [Limisphaerales bacterium]
ARVGAFFCLTRLHESKTKMAFGCGVNCFGVVWLHIVSAFFRKNSSKSWLVVSMVVQHYFLFGCRRLRIFCDGIE